MKQSLKIAALILPLALAVTACATQYDAPGTARDGDARIGTIGSAPIADPPAAFPNGSNTANISPNAGGVQGTGGK